MSIERRKFVNTISSFVIAAIFASSPTFAKKKNLTAAKQRQLPFFLGWYGNMLNQFAHKVAPRGINLLLPYVCDCDSKTIQTYLNNADKAGVKIVLPIHVPLVNAGDIPKIENFIRTHKNHPAVAAWYLYDEPEYQKPRPIDPDFLANIYRAIKREAPNIPVVVVCNDLRTIEPYTRAMDIIMWDEYPCRAELAEFAWAPTYLERLRKAARLADAQQKPFWHVLQAYGGHDTPQRLPTKGEFRYMFYAAVLAGVDSCLFWMHELSTPAWNESILYPTIAEFQAYIPAVTAGGSLPKLATADASGVEIKLFPIPKSNQIIAIAVNHGASKIATRLKLDRKFAGKLVSVNRQRITRLSSQPNLQIVLEGHEAKLYKVG